MMNLSYPQDVMCATFLEGRTYYPPSTKPQWLIAYLTSEMPVQALAASRPWHAFTSLAVLDNNNGAIEVETVFDLFEASCYILNVTKNVVDLVQLQDLQLTQCA